MFISQKQAKKSASLEIEFSLDKSSHLAKQKNDYLLKN